MHYIEDANLRKGPFVQKCKSQYRSSESSSRMLRSEFISYAVLLTMRSLKKIRSSLTISLSLSLSLTNSLVGICYLGGANYTYIENDILRLQGSSSSNRTKQLNLSTNSMSIVRNSKRLNRDKISHNEWIKHKTKLEKILKGIILASEDMKTWKEDCLEVLSSYCYNKTCHKPQLV